MYKKLCTIKKLCALLLTRKMCAFLLVVSLSFIAGFVVAYGFFAADGKKAALPVKASGMSGGVAGMPASGMSGGVAGQPARQQSPNITSYTSTGGIGPHVDRPAGTHWRIYTVTCDGDKSFIFHGFNRSGYHLSLMSEVPTWASSTVIFSDQYLNGDDKVGTLTGEGNVWTARNRFMPMWLSRLSYIFADNDQPLGALRLRMWGRTNVPPALPGDGESTTCPVGNGKWHEGTEALSLHFVDDVTFLLVGDREEGKTVEHNP